MTKLIAFILLSIPITWISWRTLFSLRNHGLYRFISWECILWLFLSDYSYWFVNPFSIPQIASWMLLFISLSLLTPAALLMRKIGEADRGRADGSLYQFEKTTKLINTGIFKYVRHPLYGSLIFLTWGIFFKNINLAQAIISLISTAFLFLTSLVEESEDIKYFGNKYIDYMKRTKMFVPFIV